jgi:hypothetical protein
MAFALDRLLAFQQQLVARLMAVTVW